MEKSKVKIRTNELAVDDQMAALESLKIECTKLVEPFNILGLGLSTKLLRDAVTGGYKEIGKVIMDQVEHDLQSIKNASIRKGMKDEAEQSLSVFKQNCEGVLRGEKRNLVEYLEVVKGQVKIASGSLETIEEQNTYYISDSREIEAYNLHLAAVEAVNRFLSVIERKPQVISQMFKYRTDIWQVEPADFLYNLLFYPKN